MKFLRKSLKFLKNLSQSLLAQEEIKLKRLKEYREFKEILKKQLADLNSEIKSLKTALIPAKPSEKPGFRRKFEICDDVDAKKQAKSLVSKLNREKKLKETAKTRELAEISKNLAENVRNIKKERDLLEQQAKFEKNNAILSRNHKNLKKSPVFLGKNLDPLQLLEQFKNNSQLNESLDREKNQGSPDLLRQKKQELNKIRNILKNK